MLQDDEFGMDQDDNEQNNELISTQQNDEEEPTQSTQGFSQQEEPWNQHLWGFLMPCRAHLKQEDFWRMHSTIRIGRSGGNDIVMTSLKISNKHCEIAWNGDSEYPQVRVTDFSTNGTFINGHKIGKDSSSFLRDGNEIGFGTWGSGIIPAEDYRYIFRFAASGRPNDGIDLRYDMGRELGKGSFATVFNAMDRSTGHIWAVKVIHKNRFLTRNTDTMNMFLREIQILESLKHDNIVMLKEVFFGATIHLVLELVEGGDLLDYICNRNGVDETMSKHIVGQLLTAMKYIHGKGIAHRDLKPENVLLTKDVPPIVKVADFGLAKAVDSMTKFKTTCGTPCYLAPEVILRENQDDAYDERVDSWSVGVIVFSMLSNCSPFRDDENMEMKERFRRRTVDWESMPTDRCSPLGYDFISRLLQFSPQARLSCTDALEHAWVTTPGDYHGIGNMDPSSICLPPGTTYDMASQSVVYMSDAVGGNGPLFPAAQNGVPFGQDVGSSYLYGSIEANGSQLPTPVPGAFPFSQSQSQGTKGQPIVRRVQDLERRDPDGISQVLQLFTPEELAANRLEEEDLFPNGHAARKRNAEQMELMRQSEHSAPPALEEAGNATPGAGPSNTRGGGVYALRNVKRKQDVPVVKAPAKPRKK